MRSNFWEQRWSIAPDGRSRRVRRGSIVGDYRVGRLFIGRIEVIVVSFSTIREVLMLTERRWRRVPDCNKAIVHVSRVYFTTDGAS